MSKFPEYIAPAARGTDTYNAEHRKPDLREFGVSAVPYYKSQRYGQSSLEWLTGRTAGPTQQHLSLAALLLEQLRLAVYRHHPLNAEQRKTGYVAQFTPPLDSPNEIGCATTDIYTMVSCKHDKLTVTQQPAVFNYADRRFRHEQGSEPVPVHIPEHYAELVGYLELIQACLAQRVHEEEMVLAPVDSSREPTNEELLELEKQQNNGGLFARLKLTFWR